MSLLQYKHTSTFHLNFKWFISPARLDQGEFARECNCPVSCEYDTIDMKASYVEFGTIPTVVNEMNVAYFNLSDGEEHPRNDSNFYK